MVKESYCSTALECFLSFVDMGLRSGGGIGDNIPKISFKYDRNDKYFFKFLIDIIFHIFVVLILGNIFFGIIVDAFNQLRDQMNENDADKKNKCFMCNRDRFVNIQGENFDHHRTHKHKPFNYLYFVIHLLRKNPKEYSMAEQFTWEQINLKKMEWFPGIIEE